MIKVTVLCIGKLKERYWREACDEYAKRLSAWCKFTIIELPESRLPENPAPAQIERALEEEGERLPATYANFLILNDAVLYPTYRQPENDARAGKVLQEAFPGYEIIGIDCCALIKQHGSLHCVTMQYPVGVLK